VRFGTFLFARSKDEIKCRHCKQEIFAKNFYFGLVGFNQKKESRFTIRIHPECFKEYIETSYLFRRNKIAEDLFIAYYGDTYEKDELINSVWARIPHIYRTPFYVYQYATCFASSAKLYSDVTTGTEEEKEAAKEEEKYHSDLQKYEDEEQNNIANILKDIQNKKDVDPVQKIIELQMKQEELTRKKEVNIEQKKRELKRQYDKIQTEYNLKKQRLQSQYKMWAVVLPPIPPLLVAILVFSLRRRSEREGVAKSRLR